MLSYSRRRQPKPPKFNKKRHSLPRKVKSQAEKP